MLFPTKKLSRYFTHTDSELAPYVIANGELVETNDIFLISDSDGNVEEKTTGQLLDFARSQQFSLIKIIGEGGIGKSTLLLSLAYAYCEKYTFISLEQFEERTFEEVIEDIVSTVCINENPVVFLIDDAANSDISEDLKKFVAVIQKRCEQAETIFILAERANRYNTEFEDDEIEDLFSGNIQSIEHVPLAKGKLFNKIYSWFQMVYPQLCDSELEATSQKIFMESAIESISESTFLLIQNLKLTHKIKYDFDWDDWNNFTKEPSEFSDLKNLFIIISCFYQFGIKLPISLKSSALKHTDRLTILRAINALGIEQSPIVLKDNNQYLILKHEYIADWFLREKEHANLAQGFFREFICEINNETSAKLLRKIRKVSQLSEFNESCLAQEFSYESYIRIIDQYLENRALSTEEIVKMLNEKGLALSALGNKTEAIAVLGKAIDIKPSSNHARDQIAKIYLKDQKTYSLALNKYLEIFNLGGIYAMLEILKLLKYCKEEGIILEYIPESIPPIGVATVVLIKKCIFKREFEFAEIILSKIESPDFDTACCYNLLAEGLPFSEKSIFKKISYYEKAINIKNDLSVQMPDYKFEIDYALFLFRIGNFDLSKKIIDQINKDANEGEKKERNKLFESKCRIITKLFYRNIPRWEDTEKYREFFQSKLGKARGYVDVSQKNEFIILKGILILETVKFHSKIGLKDIYRQALLILANCFMVHATKNIRGISVNENRQIAEYYYDAAFNSGANFDKKLAVNMIRNLLGYQNKEKAKKAIQLIDNFLYYPDFMRFPDIYRYRGVAKQMLGMFNQAMDDFEISLVYFKEYVYSDTSIYRKSKSYLLNNMATLILLSIHNQVSLKGYTLIEAQKFCKESLRLNPKFQFAVQTLNEVNGLLRYYKEY